MVNLRRVDKGAAIQEKVALLFYKVMEKKGKTLLKPLPFKTEIPIVLAKAVLDNTITDRFYQQLVADLQQRGVPEGAKVQLRVKFTPSNSAGAPPGLHVLCEVTV